MLKAIWNPEGTAVIGLGLTDGEALANAIDCREDHEFSVNEILKLKPESICEKEAEQWGYVGVLCDFENGEELRLATVAEYEMGIHASSTDGATGGFTIGDRSYYVTN
jgi:hypothetical protein